MSTKPIKTNLLIVEDQKPMQQMLEDFLQPIGFEVRSCDSADQACELLGLNDSTIHRESLTEQLSSRFDFRKATATSAHSPFDVVLTDVKMPGMNGLEFCRHVIDRYPKLPVIVMTAYGSLETAVDALRAGAFDFATKPIELELLKACLIRAAETSQLRRRVRHLEVQSRSEQFGGLVGQSDEILRLKDQLSRIVDSSPAVLLTGESGSGKEVVARELHDKSERSDKPFVAVNCSALPESLFESELFGHKKGAFTDATEDRVGLFVQADGGTLFLDEIGEMPIEMQPKLLRAIEQKTVRPVGGQGGDSEQSFDVRLIAATNRDLETAIEEKRFREDLYYRINVLEIKVPPLRTRGTDVLLLANHFLEKFAVDRDLRFDELVLEKLLAYNWPGNVRELRNVVERAVVLAVGNQVTLDVIPKKIIEHSPSQLVIEHSNQPLASLDTIQLQYIQYVLAQTGGNKSEAAKVLGLDRKTLYRKLKERE